MQIIFIHHSCFLVELDDKVLIFDYFDGDKVEGMHFTGKLPSYEPDTKIYMFASHSHKDHYDMDILRLTGKYPNIHYVFSKDIRISPHFLSKHGIDPTVRDRVTFVSPDNTYHVETVVLLSHKKADSYIHIDVEFGEGEGKIPVDSIAKRAEAYKPKEKVTYKMIKEYIEAKYGFKVHTAYIAEVKRDLGLPMYDAPNAVEELKQPRKHPTPEKVEAIKDALRYFAVI